VVVYAFCIALLRLCSGPDELQIAYLPAAKCTHASVGPGALRLCVPSATTTVPIHNCMHSLAQAHDDRPHQAKDHQYPAWQRMQWADWREMQLTAEAKRRFAAGLLACGIMIVLALKLIAANASGAVSDKADE